jgi:molybdate/tungstate transport system ATP-binding protein
MSSLHIQELSYEIDDFRLNKINIDIQKGNYFVLLGPSGSGKTKLLESLAGLTPCNGSIYFDNTTLSDKTPEERKIGFVYQEFALFPNLNVEENIRFSGKYTKIENAETHFEDMVAFLEVGPLLRRKISELSGGEKQRVALARALYAKPDILLLDEPLSAIDPTFKHTIMKRLRSLHKRYKLTTIHVTHNFREATYLADRIAIIINGEIKQIGTPTEVFNRPSNRDIACFLGYKNIFPLTLLGKSEDKRYFSIDPNLIMIQKDQTHMPGYITLKGTLVESIWGTDHFKHYVRVDDKLLFVKSPITFHKALPAKVGESVTLYFDPKDIHYL